MPRQLVALDSRSAATHAAVQKRDVQLGHRADRELVDRRRQHAAPRQPEAHAVEQSAVDVVGRRLGNRVPAPWARRARDDDSLFEVERARQLERKVALQAARPLDLDVDDALVPRTLQIAGDR